MSARDRPIVHIGMAKAASTFLQLEVFPNLEGLSNLGKHHVSDALSAAGAALTRRTSVDWRLDQFRVPFEDGLANAKREGLRPVYSEEDLSVYKFLDPETMARRLRDILGPYDVLLIVREPISWIRSQYLFRLEHQNPVAALGFETWLSTHLDARRIGSDLLELWYHPLALTYQSICGGRVHILPYELMRADKPRFAEALSQVLGTPTASLETSLSTPAKTAAHKLRTTAQKQVFFELYRYVVLQNPTEAEVRARKFLEQHGKQPLPRRLDERLRDLGAAQKIDRKAWAELFRAMARQLPGDGPAASPALPADVEKQLHRVARQQLHKLNQTFGFDLSAYGISYESGLG